MVKSKEVKEGSAQKRWVMRWSARWPYLPSWIRQDIALRNAQSSRMVMWRSNLVVGSGGGGAFDEDEVVVVDEDADSAAIARPSRARSRAKKPRPVMAILDMVGHIDTVWLIAVASSAGQSVSENQTFFTGRAAGRRY